MIDLDQQLRAATKLAKQNGQHRLYKVCIRMKRIRMKNALTVGAVKAQRKTIHQNYITNWM